MVFVLLLLGAFASAAQETKDPAQFHWSEEHAGDVLSLDGYKLTFSEEFDSNTITDDGGKGPWFAPVHADVSVTLWDKPSAKTDVYSVSDGVLRIRAYQAANGTWHAGSIQTIDSKGKGFAQQYGYFEARMRFPAKPGAWCAFWLKSQVEDWDRTVVRPEIDVVEWYGGDPKGHHETVHLWPPPAQLLKPGQLAKHWYLSNYTGMHSLLDYEWHTHGVLLTPEFVIMYVDRKEVSRFPTLGEFKTPLYPLVSLTLYKQDLDKARPPIDLLVDYVRVYSLPKAPRPPEELRGR
jgi:hypothetical protein